MVLGQRDGNAAAAARQALQDETPRRRKLLLRGLHFAIVDEADSVLDRRSAHAADHLRRGDAAAIEAGLRTTRWRSPACSRQASTSTSLPREQRVVLTDRRPRAHLRSFASAARRHVARRHRGARSWRARRSRRCTCFSRDQHYLVRDGKVQIIDEYTGRVMPDRSWERRPAPDDRGPRKAAKSPAQRSTLARITYQRFFRRYLRLSGMTGTAREVARELWTVYRLPVVTIPTHRPRQRKTLAIRTLNQ